MRTLSRWILTAAVVALVGGSALAQQPRQPGGGMNMAAFALGSGLKPRLLDNEELQKEIKLTDEQRDKIKKFADKAAEGMNLGGGGGGVRPGGGGGGGLGGMGMMLGGGGGQSDEEQLESLKKQIARIEERVKFFKETLTADQAKRIAQLEIQMMGMRAFGSEKIVAELKLTDEQKESVKKINDEFTKESSDLAREYGFGGGRPGGGGGGGGGGFDAEKFAEYQKKTKVLSEEAQEKIEKALTADQKKAWSGLIGTPFDTAKLRPQFGGRGGN